MDGDLDLSKMSKKEILKVIRILAAHTEYTKLEISGRNWCTLIRCNEERSSQNYTELIDLPHFSERLKKYFTAYYKDYPISMQPSTNSEWTVWEPEKIIISEFSYEFTGKYCCAGGEGLFAERKKVINSKYDLEVNAEFLGAVAKMFMNEAVLFEIDKIKQKEQIEIKQEAKNVINNLFIC